MHDSGKGLQRGANVAPSRWKSLSSGCQARCTVVSPEPSKTTHLVRKVSVVLARHLVCHTGNPREGVIRHPPTLKPKKMFAPPSDAVAPTAPGLAVTRQRSDSANVGLDSSLQEYPRPKPFVDRITSLPLTRHTATRHSPPQSGRPCSSPGMAAGRPLAAGRSVREWVMMDAQSVSAWSSGRPVVL